MNNPTTIPHHVQASIGFALVAKLTQDKPDLSAALGTFLQTLPLDMRDSLSERIMHFDINTDLNKLIGMRAPGKRFLVHSAADALKPQPPIDWIVEGLFSSGTVSIVAGAPGSKKTYSLMDMAVCVGLGKPWLDFSTTKAPVLLIDEESGVRRINRRLGNVLRGHGADEAVPLYYISLARFDLRSENSSDLTILEEKITEIEAKLIVIDALADIMPGADENSVKDIQPIFMRLREVADRTQSAIVMIHHMNKNGTYRGSSAISGAIEVMMYVNSEPHSPNINFKIQKNRDDKPVDFAAVAHFETDRFSLTSSQFVRQQRFGKPHTYVLQYLMKNGESSIADITAHADLCSSKSARKSVYELVGSGLVERTDGGRSGKLATYGLTEHGKSKMSPVM